MTKTFSIFTPGAGMAFFPCLAFMLAFFLATGGANAAEWRGQPMFRPQAQATPLSPFLDYYIDENFSMDIEEAAAQSRAKAYQPLVLEKMPRAEGIVWLRFTMAPLAPEEKSPVFLLDMGQSVPGEPKLYDPARNELSGALEWRENTPAQRNILLLPEASSEPLVCYIRLDGMPGPWFAPMVRSPQDAASNWGSLSRTGAVLALAVVMLLCLLRGLSEHGQWRVWAALFVAATLGQALLGMPQASDGFSVTGLAAVLLPGIALMLLPHVGRHLIRAAARSRVLDMQLALLSLPGAALALLPLLPGWNWLDRWLDLWPAGTLLFVPTALGAWIMGLGGARRFLIGCLIPPFFVAVAYFGLDFGLPPNLLASLPLWGVALSALLIAATRAPAIAEEKDKESEAAPDAAKQPETPAVELEPVISLDHPLDDPNLRLITPGKDPEEALTSRETWPAPVPGQDRSATASSQCPNGFEARENALREPLDELLREGAALGQCALPPAVRQYAEKMLAASQRIADIISDNASGHESCPGGTSEKETASHEIFNLQATLRNAHDYVATQAENAGIALSWYMPPHLRQFYRGDAAKLENVLRLLLESAVRATDKGAVHVTARKVPESPDPGHIIFTVTDTGRGYPPKDRSSLALAKAWELAGKYAGFLGLESGPQGVSIAFSAHFTPADEDGEASSDVEACHVVLACEDAAKRRELARIIETLPCRASEAASVREALANQAADPAPVLITCGRMALPSAADMVHEFAALAEKAGFEHCSALAITMDDSQWSLLKPSGFTHAMLEPVDPEVLRGTVGDLLKNAARSKNKSQMQAAEACQPAQAADVQADLAMPETATPQISPELPDTPEELEQPAPAPEPEKAAENNEAPESPGIAAGREPETKTEEAEEPASDAGYAPTMLIEQDFGLARNFEGPLWLDADDTAQKPAGEPQEDDAAPQKEEAVRPAENQGAHLAASFEEWVGEPMPILPGGASGAENSGEASGQEKAAARNSDSLMDFIVGVERRDEASLKLEKTETSANGKASTYAAAKANAREAIAAARKNSTVSDFVNSSVELVAKALSSVLAAPEPPRKELNFEIVEPPVPEEKKAAPAPPHEEAQKPGPQMQAQTTRDIRSDPAIVALVERLDRNMKDAEEAFACKNGAKVAECAGRIAREAESFALRLLARMALCVERAARANDLAALRDLLPELANAVERNRITLTQKK